MRTSFRILTLTGFVLFLQPTALQPTAMAQTDLSPLQDYAPVTDQLLLDPPDSDWLMWRGTYDLSGHSALEQINRDNVADLKLAWSAPLGEGGNMTTHIVFNN